MKGEARATPLPSGRALWSNAGSSRPGERGLAPTAPRSPSRPVRDTYSGGNVLPKRYIGDGVFIEVANGQFLVTCVNPSIANGIFMDAEMIQAIVRYRDEVYRKVLQQAAAKTNELINDPETKTED